MKSQLGDGSLDDENDIQTGLQRLAVLNRFNDQDVGPLVLTLSRTVDNLTVRRTELVDKLKDLTTELEDANVDRMRTSASSLGDIARKIAVTDEGIDKTQRKIVDIDNSINRLNTKLEGLGTADLRTTQARKALLSDAAEVFDKAVDHYKAQLRQRVEKSATDLFLSMTTETSDYAGLVINDNYGLEIRHREGGSETGRSAGAEHVVALALMGALQQNAPLRGPIVMDSPFGRLDPGHTSKVVETLPKMASQMVLLVHGKEVTREQLRRLLGSSLKREYELVRVSARSTRIALVE
jgi:DNA sulfur modification protein DndD